MLTFVTQGHKSDIDLSTSRPQYKTPCLSAERPTERNIRRLLSPPVPSLLQPLKHMKMPSNPRLPQRYPLRSRSRKTKTCPNDPSTPELAPFVLSPPFQPYRFLEPTRQGRHKSKYEKSPSKSLPPSRGESTSFEPANNDSERGMSGRSQISIGSEQRCISELTEFPPAHRASFLAAPALSTFESPLEGDLPKPVMSDDPPETPLLSKEPWGGPAMTSTITSSMLARTCPPGMSALPQRVHYLIGSKPCSTRLILDSEPSSPEPKILTTGGSQQTSFGTAAPPSEFVPS